MCFSPVASFGAGAVLAAAGAASLKQCHKPSQIPFASIPLLFSAQQISEGFVWLYLQDKLPALWGYVAIHTFLFFAQVIWPAWVPLSIWKLEINPARKKLLIATLCMGIFTSLGLAYLIFRFPVEALVRSHHIFYQRKFTAVTSQVSVLYLISTVIPCLVSSYRQVRWLGLALVISVIVSYFFAQQEFISVWCYFAATLSVMIYFILRQISRLHTTPTD